MSGGGEEQGAAAVLSFLIPLLGVLSAVLLAIPFFRDARWRYLRHCMSRIKTEDAGAAAMTREAGEGLEAQRVAFDVWDLVFVIVGLMAAAGAAICSFVA